MKFYTFITDADLKKYAMPESVHSGEYLWTLQPFSRVFTRAGDALEMVRNTGKKESYPYAILQIEFNQKDLAELITLFMGIVAPTVSGLQGNAISEAAHLVKGQTGHGICVTVTEVTWVVPHTY